MIRTFLYRWAARTAAKAIADRDPDELIFTGDDLPYMRRWHVRRRWLGRFNVYAHEFCRDDVGPHLHDHPWHSLSVVVSGRYIEEMEGAPRVREAGDVIFRRATQLHRIRLYRDAREDDPYRLRRVITVFVTGPKIREWGFRTENGWVHWRQYLGVRPAEAAE